MMPWIAVSRAHGEAELDATLAAFDAALRVYAEALSVGRRPFLVGAPVRPVFRTRN
jgi:glutamate-1-semialdehyde 2,1-aminomutase